MHRSSIRKTVSGLVGLLWLTACGGSPTPESPSTPARERTPSTPNEDQTSDPTGDPFASETPAEAPHPNATCTEGQCFECGNTTCLRGFYCDETLAACAWLPACTEKLSCECLLSQLPSCSCQTRDGNVFVTCTP